MILLPHFTRSLLLRSLLPWAFFRVLTTTAGAALAPPGANPLRLGFRATLLTLAVVGVVGWVSARRRNEDLFLVSLGHGRARLLATFVLPAALAELAVQVAARL